MRKLFLWLLACLTLLIVVVAAVGMGTALGLQWAGLAHGMTVSIDGETIQGSLLAAGIGGAAALVAGIVCVVVVLALASAAIIVPLAIVLALAAAVIAVLVGLSPLLIPVLLVVGVCALLSRRSRRRAASGDGTLPAAPTTP